MAPLTRARRLHCGDKPSKFAATNLVLGLGVLMQVLLSWHFAVAQFVDVLTISRGPEMMKMTAEGAHFGGNDSHSHHGHR